MTSYFNDVFTFQPGRYALKCLSESLPNKVDPIEKCKQIIDMDNISKYQNLISETQLINFSRKSLNHVGINLKPQFSINFIVSNLSTALDVIQHAKIDSIFTACLVCSIQGEMYNWMKKFLKEHCYFR